MNEHVRRLVVRHNEVRPKSRHGRLRVLGEAFRVQYNGCWKELNVVCECSCGAVCIAKCPDLTGGKTGSCGCV